MNTNDSYICYHRKDCLVCDVNHKNPYMLKKITISKFYVWRSILKYAKLYKIMFN